MGNLKLNRNESRIRDDDDDDGRGGGDNRPLRLRLPQVGLVWAGLGLRSFSFFCLLCMVG